MLSQNVQMVLRLRRHGDTCEPGEESSSDSVLLRQQKSRSGAAAEAALKTAHPRGRHENVDEPAFGRKFDPGANRVTKEGSRVWIPDE